MAAIISLTGVLTKLEPERLASIEEWTISSGKVVRLPDVGTVEAGAGWASYLGGIDRSISQA